MANDKSRISTDIDFEKAGKQVSWLRLPYSSNVSAYGWIPIPICVIRNGDGPTVLLTAGNHGDEYEGQVSLVKLIQSLEPDDIRGRLIIVPALNSPAALAGLRTSPIDMGNLNRSFPGHRDGTPTQMIAHYVETELMPLADYSMDLHSGGRTLIYIPSVLMRWVGDDAIDEKTLGILKAFGAPVGYIVTGPAEDRTMLGAASRNNTISVGTELGGGGMVGVEALKVVERGLRQVLSHLGVLAAPVQPILETQRLVEVAGPSYYVYAPDKGLFEPFCELGDEVQKGQLAGHVHFVDNPAREPIPVHFDHDGLVLCKRFPGPCERGDCLAHLATDWAGAPRR